VNSSSQSSSSDQSTTANPSSTTGASPDSGATAGQTSPDANQSNANQSNANQSSTNQSNGGSTLPQTASPLPLIGLLGFGGIAAGLVTRRKK
jgi:cobalamin biosynthesis Mg chelatase CobN